MIRKTGSTENRWLGTGCGGREVGREGTVGGSVGGQVVVWTLDQYIDGYKRR